jgi:hypothetical protein
MHFIRRRTSDAAGFELIAVQIGKEKACGLRVEFLQQNAQGVFDNGIEVEIGA